MKYLFAPLIFFVSSYTFACSDILDTEMRVLDSSESVNLCEYQEQVIPVSYTHLTLPTILLV